MLFKQGISILRAQINVPQPVEKEKRRWKDGNSIFIQLVRNLETTELEFIELLWKFEEGRFLDDQSARQAILLGENLKICDWMRPETSLTQYLCSEVLTQASVLIPDTLSSARLCNALRVTSIWISTSYPSYQRVPGQVKPLNLKPPRRISRLSSFVRQHLNSEYVTVD